MRRTYSDGQVAEALAVVDACGGNVLRASRTTQIPRKTLEFWTNGQAKRVSAPGVAAELEQRRQETRGELVSKLEGIAWQLAEAIPDKIEHAPLIQIAISFGIVVDKIRLLREGSSTNSKTETQRRQWAQEKLQELMRDGPMERDQALELLRKEAPTVYGLLS